MKKRFTDEQIIGFLKQADGGIPVRELCRQHSFSDASFYTWSAKFGGMTIPDRSAKNYVATCWVSLHVNFDMEAMDTLEIDIPAFAPKQDVNALVTKPWTHGKSRIRMRNPD